MCSVCGCGEREPEIKVHGGSRDCHRHTHPHQHHATDDLDPEVSPTSETSHEAMPSRLVAIERDILAENDRYARANRQRLQRSGVLALNLVSSPGSGKTTLLVETIRALAPEMSVAVVEGDQQTTRDAERIRATGTQALQINTGKGCHLDAHMVGHALEALEPPAGGVLFIENVGNLVCPAGFDLGEAHKVVVLSATEGDDKPLKYADMFSVADLMILNKCDLLPYLDFDLGRCVEYARRVNPDIEIVQLSACSGEGMSAWLDWVRERRVVAASKIGEAIA